jgi:hypothetical protein
MMLKPWITSLAVVSTLTIAGLALAQTPTPQPAQPEVQRGTGVSMTNPSTPDGKPITKHDQPPIERGTGTSMTNPITPDGKPITTSTSFGQR